MIHILSILFLSFIASANVSTISYSELRDERKLGAGFQLLGASGNAGILLEMNFHPTWGLNIGYGTAPDFQTFQLEYKQVLYSGNQLITYGSLGFTRWFGESEGSIESTNPGFVAKKLMSSKDRREGIINENLLYPGIGIQYFNFGGDWKGFSIFAQAIVLMDVEDFVFVPTLGLGSTYFF